MHDFLAIGDTVTDAFIKLKDADTKCDINTEKCTITLPFAEKIPYESVEEVNAVGNSANASVAAARLGLKSALVTNLGSDDNGRRCLEKFVAENVGTKFISVHNGKKSNYHYVLWYKAERTILVKHEDYHYKLPDIGNPKLIYLSSLGPKTKEYHHEIENYLKSHPAVNLVFQPGTFQIMLGTSELKEVYKKTKLFVCNVTEAEKILGNEGGDIKELLEGLKDLGPERVIISDGTKGAYVYDGVKMWHQSAYPDSKPPIDRTGAGDALASTVASALALGENLETAVKWGMINAMSVVQEIGAQKGLLTREKIKKYLKKAPPEFQTKKI